MSDEMNRQNAVLGITTAMDLSKQPHGKDSVISLRLGARRHLFAIKNKFFSDFQMIIENEYMLAMVHFDTNLTISKWFFKSAIAHFEVLGENCADKDNYHRNISAFFKEYAKLLSNLYQANITQNKENTPELLKDISIYLYEASEALSKITHKETADENNLALVKALLEILDQTEDIGSIKPIATTAQEQRKTLVSHPFDVSYVAVAYTPSVMPSPSVVSVVQPGSKLSHSSSSSSSSSTTSVVSPRNPVSSTTSSPSLPTVMSAPWMPLQTATQPPLSMMFVPAPSMLSQATPQPLMAYSPFAQMPMFQPTYYPLLLAGSNITQNGNNKKSKRNDNVDKDKSEFKRAKAQSPVIDVTQQKDSDDERSLYSAPAKSKSNKKRNGQATDLAQSMARGGVLNVDTRTAALTAAVLAASAAANSMSNSSR